MEKLFLQVLDLSIAASWVILAVMAARLLLRKAPKVYSYALWAAVGFRLVSSVSVSSLLSLFNLKSFQKAVRSTGELQFVPRDIGFAEVPQISTGIPAVDTVVNNQLPAPILEASVNPMQIMIFVGMILWLAGMTVMVAISVINYIRLRKSLRFAVRKEDNIWQCETVRSPFLVGVVKPKIYIPYGLDEQTESYILAHEKYHLKRFDHIVKLVAYALLTVHWFNPLCHLAFRLMNRDMEMSCDEHVLNRNEIPTTQYSLSLLTIATNRRFPAATPLAFAETGVKERMINVLNWKKPKKWVTAVAVLVCAILLISCATNPKWTEPELDGPTMLEFPGIKWGMTVDEVKAALNLEEDQISAEYYGEEVCRLVVKDLTLFDNQVEIALFDFLPPERGRYGLVPSETDVFGLSDIQAYFTEDTDMIKVRDTMIEIYGEGNTYGHTAHYLIDGEIVERIWPGETSAEYHYYWPGSSKTKDVIPAGKMQEEIAHYASVFPEATMDTIEELIGLRTLGLIGLVDHTVKEGYTPATGYTGKVVKFYGSDICQLRLNYGE